MDGPDRYGSMGDRANRGTGRSAAWWIATGAAMVAVVLLLFSSLFVVEETGLAVVLRFGEPVRVIDRAGLYAKWPFPIDQVAEFDRRLMVFDLPTRDDPPRELLTLDKKNIEVSSYTCWRIGDARRFLETVGDRAGAEAYLADVVLSELGKVLGRHPLHALISVDPDSIRLDAIAAGVRAACDEVTRRECGIEVTDFAVKRVNFPEQNRSSVFDRMRAERKQIATRYRSEGDQLAQTIRAEADRQATQILAEATRQALEIRGQGEADAAAIYNQAYGKDREFYKFLRSLESYETTLSEGTTFILPRDMDYLQTLIRGGAR